MQKRTALLPPSPGVCQVCAQDHEPGEPHNRDSLYWAFARQEQGLPPATWSDAIAHCSEATQKLWATHLGELAKVGRIDRSRLGPLIDQILNAPK